MVLPSESMRAFFQKKLFVVGGGEVGEGGLFWAKNL